MKKHTHNRESGSALITVLVLVMIVVSAGGAMIGMASQQLHSARLVRDEIKAKALAQAGANEAYAILKADFSAKDSDDAFPAKEWGGGSYDATVTPVGALMATVECTAEVGDATATVKMDVKDFGVDDGGASGAGPVPVGAYVYTIVAGSILWGGNGPTTANGAQIQSNGPFDMNGTTDVICDKISACGTVRSVGNCTITADFDAPSFTKKSPGNISGTATTTAVAPVPLPVIDMAAYYQYALANSEVYNGYSTAGGTIEPSGGVMWVNGDVHISGGADVVGCIIATGDIKITGNSDVTKVDDLPALISRDGDIDLNSGGTIEGLLYAMVGDIAMHGGGSFTGSIFCGGEFWKNGAWSAIVYDDSTPPDDPAGGGSWEEDNCQVCITCWHL